MIMMLLPPGWFEVVAAALAVAFLAPLSARSEVLAAATLEGTYTQPVNNSSWRAIHVSSGAMGMMLPFTTTKTNERIVLTYSASCIAGGFLIFVRANVDGVIASPGAATGVGLCSLPAVNDSSYPASRTFTAVVPAKGAHNISIEVKGNGAAIVIGDSALIVQR